ncbi:hypothetical protein SLH49_11515 [Cognatiyoonia sp. IB215446]|uniref:hypothetical protein n=1 Tax=Cognatiyoonia sp. IB215446 TaxID=3097355 RepID=UPI002A11DCE6|nr:hypothetical protein [Cognatiyoonia sp. IB215446]MDX8348612.1 hypothetical protein [Cognatiyoonia sp. IB215446]
MTLTFSCDVGGKVDSAPTTTLTVNDPKIRYDFSQRQITDHPENDTGKPTVGLTIGKIAASSFANFSWTHANLGSGICVQGQLNLDVVVDAEILIASEYDQDRCEANAILAHEMKYRNIYAKEAENLIDRIVSRVEMTSRASSRLPVLTDVLPGEKPASAGQSVQNLAARQIQRILDEEVQISLVNTNRLDRGLDAAEPFDVVLSVCP